MKKLPNKIVPLVSDDKTDHESWYPNRNLLDFPSGNLCIAIVGPRNSGKTTIIKNILAHKLYDSGYLCHFDSDSSDYVDADIDIMENGYIPSNDEIPKEGKKVLIIEDIPHVGLDKQSKNNLLGLIKYACSHKLLDIIYTAHDLTTGVPVELRRMFNVFIIYRMPDLSAIRIAGDKVGISSSDFQKLFQKFIKNPHDNICIDLTKNSPAPLRYNLFNKIKVVNQTS
jgi:hypothetical protein